MVGGYNSGQEWPYCPGAPSPTRLAGINLHAGIREQAGIPAGRPHFDAGGISSFRRADSHLLAQGIVTAWPRRVKSGSGSHAVATERWRSSRARRPERSGRKEHNVYDTRPQGNITAILDPPWWAEIAAAKNGCIVQVHHPQHGWLALIFTPEFANRQIGRAHV